MDELNLKNTVTYTPIAITAVSKSTDKNENLHKNVEKSNKNPIMLNSNKISVKDSMFNRKIEDNNPKLVKDFKPEIIKSKNHQK